MNYIYTRSNPPFSYCTRVKALLDAYGIPYTEIDLEEPGVREMFKEQCFQSVPQVFINNEHIGGYEATARFFRNPSEGSTTYEVNN